MTTVNFKIENCMDCPNHQVQCDPDPDDWFCGDDEKVVCKVSGKTVTVACRPYNKRKECEVPKWRPLIANKKKEQDKKRHAKEKVKKAK
jgi:hypothetical protein